MLHQAYLRNAFRHQDYLEIEPLDGRRRRVELKRTRIEINHFPALSEKFSPQAFSLRSTEGEKGQYSLTLEQFGEKKLYRMTSLNGAPFIHNGNISFSGLLRRGDIVDIGLYRFRCCHQKRVKEEQLPLEHWPSEMFVSLEGETGTGKTSLARKLHDHFVGPQFPFIAINISAFSAGLIESEIFGHEKGAFTGAVGEKRGAVELAREGTLFIDELDSLPIPIQIKILTFLDERKFRRVGGEKERRARCRVIFSSGRSLYKLVHENQFRDDLYYRVSSGITLKLKPLREDRQLIQKHLIDFEEEFGLTLSKELRDFLMNYPWPGNYRQLHSHLLRKKFLTKGCSLLELGESERELLQKKSDFNEVHEVVPLEQFKRDYCKSVLLRNRGKVELTSKQLKIAKSTLRRLTAA